MALTPDKVNRQWSRMGGRGGTKPGRVLYSGQHPGGISNSSSSPTEPHPPTHTHTVRRTIPDLTEPLTVSRGGTEPFIFHLRRPRRGTCGVDTQSLHQHTLAALLLPLAETPAYLPTHRHTQCARVMLTLSNVSARLL